MIHTHHGGKIRILEDDMIFSSLSAMVGSKTTNTWSDNVSRYQVVLLFRPSVNKNFKL